MDGAAGLPVSCGDADCTVSVRAVVLITTSTVFVERTLEETISMAGLAELDVGDSRNKGLFGTQSFFLQPDVIRRTASLCK